MNTNFIGITTLHVLGSLSAHHQEFLAVHRLWYILCSCDAPFTTSSILLLVANGSSQVHKMYQSRCTAKNSWWWAEGLPETGRVVIPIKLEFSASVGFIHKESSMASFSVRFWSRWGRAFGAKVQVSGRKTIGFSTITTRPLTHHSFDNSKNITVIPPLFTLPHPLRLFPIHQDEITAERALFWHDWGDPHRNARGYRHTHI